MKTIESTAEMTWQDPVIPGHRIIHQALTDEQYRQIGSDTLTVRQTAILLDMSELEIMNLIRQEVLCAKVDDTTGEYTIDRCCAETQKSSFMSAQRPSSNQTQYLSDLFALDGLSEDSSKTSSRTRLSSVGISDAGNSSHSSLEVSDEPTASPTAIDGAGQVKNNFLSPAIRAETTSKSMDTLLDSLDFANVRLEGAMYRVGYLEAQVESLQEQLKVLPELRTRSAQALITDRENDILKNQLAEEQSKLEEAQALLSKIQEHKLFKFCCWALGVHIV